MRAQSKSYDAVLTPKSVTFLGLGVMGYPMAQHLALAGHSVTVYNRNADKAQQWLHETREGLMKTAPSAQNAAAHIKVAQTVKEAVQSANIVFSCVSNDAALFHLTIGQNASKTAENDENTNKNTLNSAIRDENSQGAFAYMQPGSTFVDHSTVSVHLSQQLSKQAALKQIHFIDAPVSGGQSGAEKGMLSVMAGADDASAFEGVKPLIMAYAQTCVHMGTSGKGQLTKMVNQICIAGLVQGLSEALAFGMKAELNMQKVLEVIGKGAAQSWQMHNRGQTMVENRFDFGFAVDLMRKDLGLVLEQARHQESPLPVTALVDQFYADLQAQGDGKLDTSSLIKRLK